jgi:hypothetical protein
VKQQHYSPTRGEVLEPTDARQANSRKMNLRVLIFSTSLIVLVFAGFVLAFLYATPAPMDGSSQEGAQSGQTTSVPPAPKPLPSTTAPENPGKAVQP